MWQIYGTKDITLTRGDLLSAEYGKVWRNLNGHKSESLEQPR